MSVVSRKWKGTTLVVFGILIATGTTVVVMPARDPLAAKVHTILVQEMAPARNNQWNAGMDHLWALGPEIIPRLAAETRVRDTIWSRAYARIWTKLPPRMRQRLSPPLDRDALRNTAMRAIAEFGPLAVRRAAPTVIAGLGETNENRAITCLRWLLPDSAPAMAALKTGLSGTNGNWPPPHHFMGEIGDDAVWSRIPAIFPLLTNHLGNARDAYSAATALGRLGTNAVPAIPRLIQILDPGAANSFTNALAASGHAAKVYRATGGWAVATVANHNPAMAALALGRIGIATTNVCAALARAWNSPDPWVRRNAAEAVALLGPPMTNELPELLRELPDNDNSALDQKLLAMGKLGPGARAALEALRQLSEPKRVLSIVTNTNTKVVGWSAADLALSAKMAICRIDPQEGRAFLPEITDKIGYWSEPVLCLMELRSLSNEVVRAVEPLLEQSGSGRQSLAAYVILSYDPKHAKAQAVLRRNTSSGELNDQLLAAQWLFQSLGETNGLCELIAEGFASPQRHLGENAASLADKMGDAAKPALPAIKAALWHKDPVVRNWAGVLMLKLAPEDIPINGGN